MARPYTIMFVCTGNTCRSPMAEGALKVLLEKKRPGKFRVISSGTGAARGFPATMYAVEAAKMWECNLSDHSSQLLSRDLIEMSDLIIAMAPEHLREIHRLSPDSTDRSFLLKKFPDPATVGDGVEDPIGQSLDKYNEVFLDIGEYLGRRLDEIVRRIDEATDA